METSFVPNPEAKGQNTSPYKANHFSYDRVITGARLRAPCKLVLFVLNCHRNVKTLRCDPTVKTIAVEASLSERTTQMALSELENLGYVQREVRFVRGVRTSNQYTLRDGQMPQGADSAPPPPVCIAPPRAECGLETVQQVHPNNVLSIEVETETASLSPQNRYLDDSEAADRFRRLGDILKPPGGITDNILLNDKGPPTP